MIDRRLGEDWNNLVGKDDLFSLCNNCFLLNYHVYHSFRIFSQRMAPATEVRGRVFPL